jgi:hypothetical protein
MPPMPDVAVPAANVAVGVKAAGPTRATRTTLPDDWNEICKLWLVLAAKARV